jgi:two-component system sensor kinase FixL
MREATSHQPRTGQAIFPRLFALPHAAIGAAYLACYVLLDWISFVYPFAPGINITPWNPPPGLSFVLILLFGRRMIPYLFVAPFLGDLTIRQLPLSWTLELATTAIIGCGYSLALLFLLWPRIRFHPALLSLRDLLLLLMTAAASAALVAISYVGAVILAGIIPVEDFFAGCLRYWIGDLIGIAVVAPFGLMISGGGPPLKISVETAAQFAALFVALVLVFGIPHEQELQLFYIIFLPMIWLAIRVGLKGVTAGILVAQIGLIVGVHMLSKTDVDVMAFQLLMLVLAITGLIAGALVTERRRAESQLRLHQDSLARSARLRSVGELAAAVAHEINQPLTAAGTYSRLVRDRLHRDRGADPSFVEIADKATAQVERATEVVRRLRALVTLNKTDRAKTTVGRIVNEALDTCQEELNRSGINHRTILEDNLPFVIVDCLQIEQVLLNLVRNAIEAINRAGSAGGVITVEAKKVKGDVELSVRDTGPGFPEGRVIVEFLPFVTTKAQGLGIGLALSRTIVETHGGHLTAEGTTHGTVVRFTLPAATKP